MSDAYLALLWRTPTRPLLIWLSEPDAPTLAKRMEPIPAGARWITVHPNGKDTTGIPVLIQETTPGSGVHRVIGGAGGKLNYLRMTGVRPGSDYTRTLSDKAKARAAQKKQQRQADKSLGIDKSKKEQKQAITQHVGEEQRAVIEAVAEAMGWKDHVFDPTPYESLSKEAQTKAYRQHQREWLSKARAAIDAQRKALLLDHERRGEALPEVPLHADASDTDTIALPDLDPEPAGKGLGYTVDFKGQAEAHGVDESAIKAEAQALDDQAPEEVREARSKRKATVEAIQKELDAARQESASTDAPIRLADAEKAAALIRAEKKLDLLTRKAQEAKGKIERSSADEVGSMVMDIGQATDEDIDAAIARDFDHDLRVASATAFLDQARSLGVTGKHLGIGAYNAINSLSVAATGTGLVDRMALDVLGVAGAAHVLARRLHADLGPEEVAQIQAAIESYHHANYMESADKALGDALRAQKAAEELTLDAAQHGHDLARMQEINHQRRAMIAEARRVMGQTLGEMEANAALVVALKGKPKDTLDLSLGTLSSEAAVRRVRALGLSPGDYTLTTAAGQRVLTLHTAGLDKLTQSIDRDADQATRRAYAIQHGHEDEPGWIPQGIARRPDLVAKPAPGVAPRLATPMSFASGNIQQALKDYIAARTADGDHPRDIRADVFSQAFATQASAEQASAFFAARDALLPHKDPDGALIQPEDMQEQFEGWAQEWAKRTHGGRLAPLQRQSFPVDETAVEALHRAFASEPAGPLAYKAVGDLTPKEQGALREAFNRVFKREEPDAKQRQSDYDEHLRREPDRWKPGTTPAWRAWNTQAQRLRQIMQAADPGTVEHQEAQAAYQAHIDAHRDFADDPTMGESQAWSVWEANRKDKLQALRASSFGWGDYVHAMRSPAAAYEAMQDILRGRVAEAFHQTYNTLRPETPLKLGRGTIRHHLEHLDAVDPSVHALRMEREAEVRKGQARTGTGQYSFDDLTAKIQADREQENAFNLSQMDLFGGGGLLGDSGQDDLFGGGGQDDLFGGQDDLFGDPSPKPAAKPEPKPEPPKPLEPDQRATLGHVAERTLAGMAGIVGQNFTAGKPVKLWHVSMDGRYVNQQRAIKQIIANRKVSLAAGVGSGKTLVGLGAFAHLHATGQAKRGLFVAPSAVQAQMGGEALRYLDPQAGLKWHAVPGASREERLAAYRDPQTHFSVVTHQALRDDLVHLTSQMEGITPEEATNKLKALPATERKAYLQRVMSHGGMDHDFVFFDEAHDALNSQEGSGSLLAAVFDGVGHSAKYQVRATADPVKNDPAEVFRLLRSLDPERYHDAAAFQRRYGVDTPAAKDALRREMARYHFPASVDPDVTAQHTTESIKLTDEQHAALRSVDQAAARLRLSRMRGAVDVTAAKDLSPERFEGVDSAHHQAIADHLARNIGLTRDAAYRRVINDHPRGAKLERAAAIARERQGKPGVFFAQSLAGVRALEQRLKADGHRVVSITGKDSAKEKDRKRLLFHPEAGDAKADILIASNAAATGLNLQRGQWLVQVDTPDTAKTHQQRNGRIHRLGQTQDVDLIDLVADHPHERKARERLHRKGELRQILTSPLDGADDTGLAGYLHAARAQAQQRGLF